MTDGDTNKDGKLDVEETWRYSVGIDVDQNLSRLATKSTVRRFSPRSRRLPPDQIRDHDDCRKPDFDWRWSFNRTA